MQLIIWPGMEKIKCLVCRGQYLRFISKKTVSYTCFKYDVAQGPDRIYLQYSTNLFLSKLRTNQTSTNKDDSSGSLQLPDFHSYSGAVKSSCSTLKILMMLLRMQEQRLLYYNNNGRFHKRKPSPALTHAAITFSRRVNTTHTCTHERTDRSPVIHFKQLGDLYEAASVSKMAGVGVR